MSKIANKAGISKGLAYNYFNSKQEILDEIVRTGTDSIYTHFDLNHDGVLTENEFEYFIHKSFQVISENRRFWKLYSALMMQSDLAESFNKKYGESSLSLVNILKQFIISKGSKDPDTDLLIISSLIKGALLLVVTTPEYFNDSHIIKMEEKITKACLKLITEK
jgi:AcrR family transcriptional regulator